MSVLGLGSSGGGSGGANLVGTSFSLDTSPRITKVHGAGIAVDLDVLELHTGGGTIKYTPTHTEYVLLHSPYSYIALFLHQVYGAMKWVSVIDANKLSFYHNDKIVLQLNAPTSTPYYQFAVAGDGVFRDVLLDSTLMKKVCLCYTTVRLNF